MENSRERIQAVSLVIGADADAETAARLRAQFAPDGAEGCDLTLHLDGQGLALRSGGQTLRGDFTHMLPRLKGGSLSQELLVRTARIKGALGPLTAVDATAGLGEDSLLLAAAGFQVTLFERNPVIYELLRDALGRAGKVPELAEIVGRMELRRGDSVQGMASLAAPPDVILLDPMFPARQKSALVKKKLQIIQKLESPCKDEAALLLAAVAAGPKKLVIKRPPKGPYLAGIKPDYSTTGKAARFDCIVSPYDRRARLQAQLAAPEKLGGSKPNREETENFS